MRIHRFENPWKGKEDLESKKMDGVSSCFFSKNKSQRNSASVISFSDKHKNSPKS